MYIATIGNAVIYAEIEYPGTYNNAYNVPLWMIIHETNGQLIALCLAS